jgi:ketosteroid isomerase-like protein
MSQESVEVVRGYCAPQEGVNVIPTIRAAAEQLPPDSQPDAVAALAAEDPVWRHLHPDIEWDISSVDVSCAHGFTELALWWASWVEVWDSYVVRILEYRDLGDWVMTPAEVHAVGRNGIAVDLRFFQVWQMRDGKIAVVRLFPSERRALEALGLEI